MLVYYAGEGVAPLSVPVARYDGAGARDGPVVEASISYLPTDVPLGWWPYTIWKKGSDSIVWPPWGLTQIDPTGTFQVSCPDGDGDDPNPIQTLADGGFNAAITGPSILDIDRMMELKQEASGASDFMFAPSVINSVFGCEEPACPATETAARTCLKRWTSTETAK